MRTRLLALAVLALAAGPLPAQSIKLSASLEQLQAQAQRDSLDPNAHYLLGLGYWSAKRYDDAERELRDALAIDPRLATAELAMAYLPFARRPKLWDEIWDDRVPPEFRSQLEESDRRYRHAFLVDPMVDIRIIAAVIPSSADFVGMKNVFGEAVALFYQGFKDCQEGRYEDCHGRFTAMMRELDGERHPERVPSSAFWYKGIAAAHVGKFEPAEAHFRMLMSRNIADSLATQDLTRVPLRTNEYRYTLGVIQQAAGKPMDAIMTFQEVLNNDVGAYMAHVRLANIYEAQKNYELAIRSREFAVNVNPDDASLVMDLGITLGKAGDMAGAEMRLRQALEQNPRDVRPLFWLGIATQAQGKKDASREAFTRFIQLAPSRYERQVASARERLTQLQ